MTQSTKRIVLTCLSVTLISIILLASSLSNLQLHAGNPFPGVTNSNHTLQQNTPLPIGKTYSIPLLRGIFALIFLILMIYVPARLIALVNIKKILPLASALVALFVVIFILSCFTPSQPPQHSVKASNVTSSPSFVYPTSPLGRPPQGLILFVLFGFLLGMGYLAFRTLKQKLFSSRPDDQLLQELETAVNALHAGKDFSNVIVQCYLQMTQILKDERGIERNFNMTAREFEDWLAFKGVPRLPIRQLTYLFEKVRYGKQRLSKENEEMGVNCLNEIIQYSRKEEAPST